jgi:hypothetical protein
MRDRNRLLAEGPDGLANIYRVRNTESVLRYGRAVGRAVSSTEWAGYPFARGAFAAGVGEGRLGDSMVGTRRAS